MKEVKNLPWSQKIAYSLGHIHNDLTVSMWLTYMLVYFTGVSGISNANAGFLVFIGQVTDAISTVFVGIESDHHPGLCGFTKRKSWHLIGTVLSGVSIVFLFMPVLGGSHASDLGKVIYYTPFVISFNIGWAFIQISHMALVTEITPNESERVALTSYRHAMTLVAFVVVYGSAWLIFYDNKETSWSSSDNSHFMVLNLSVNFIGIITSILFHVFTNEPRQKSKSSEESNGEEIEMQWKDWIREIQLYIVSLAYMGSRLVVNISQIYWPFYVIHTLHLSKKYSAIIPITVYVMSFLTSISMEKLNSILKRKPTFLLGVVIMTVGLIWLRLIKPSTASQVFGPAVITGIGSTVLIVTAIAMIADLVGSHTSNGAFVYGIMGFVDKLSSGSSLMVIQAAVPECHGDCPALASFYKDVMSYGIGTFTCVCLLALLALLPFTLGNLTKFNKSDPDSEEKEILR